jgi:hypothetical protein
MLKQYIKMVYCLFAIHNHSPIQHSETYATVKTILNIFRNELHYHKDSTVKLGAHYTRSVQTRWCTVDAYTYILC